MTFNYVLPPFHKKSCIVFESLLLQILINQHAGFLHDKDGFWTCPFEGTIIFDEERSMSHLWHKEWRVVKWRRWKNMQKWANVSEPLGKINQMKFWPTSFWQLCMQPACILHAHLSRLSFSELDWFWWVFCTHIIWVFCNHQLTYLHAHFYHEVQNVCQLSRLCALHAISKSKWYVDYQTPYPMQVFLWKGGSTYCRVQSFRVVQLK